MLIETTIPRDPLKYSNYILCAFCMCIQLKRIPIAQCDQSSDQSKLQVVENELNKKNNTHKQKQKQLHLLAVQCMFLVPAMCIRSSIVAISLNAACLIYLVSLCSWLFCCCYLCVWSSSFDELHFFYLVLSLYRTRTRLFLDRQFLLPCVGVFTLSMLLHTAFTTHFALVCSCYCFATHWKWLQWKKW